MSGRRAIVTGVGAVIGYGVIKSLRRLPEAVHVVGCDIYPDAVGRHWADEFVQAIPAADERYPDFLADLARRTGASIVFFGTEQELARISESPDAVLAAGAVPVLNRRELHRVARDKWHMHEALGRLGVPRIDSAIDGEFDELAERLGVPMLLKPRRSYASKGIVPLRDRDDFAFWRARLGDNFMVQRIVGHAEREYTVGAFGLGDGTAGPQIAFQRRLSGEGATAKARVVEESALEAAVTRLVEAFRPVGPTNFQFREEGGEYLLLEINPRISSSTSLRAAFGYNEAAMCLEYFVDGRRPAVPIVRRGSAERYIEDVVTYNA